MSLSSDIDRAIAFVSGVRSARDGERARPHKPCLLLAVIDLFEAEVLQKNQIEFDATPRLLETFNSYFEAVAYPSDRKRACLPFVHLASDHLWHLEPLSGCEREVKEKISKGGITNHWIRNNIRFVRLDESVFNACFDAHAREALREAIVKKFFPHRSEEIRRVIQQSVASIHYELVLRKNDSSIETHIPSDKAARSASFRRVVLDAYDYRCAATGWRIILPSVSLVEAAHLIPWSESNDDSVQNGIALMPTYHRAMDANLIAPCTTGVWKISDALKDSRFKDFELFQELEGKSVILPSNSGHQPNNEALEYRVRQLQEV